MTTTVQGIGGLKELIGQHLGYSDYMEITQERVNLFADATGDHQWIHVDVERAKDTPFGGTIVHGHVSPDRVGIAFRMIGRNESAHVSDGGCLPFPSRRCR